MTRLRVRRHESECQTDGAPNLNMARIVDLREIYDEKTVSWLAGTPSITTYRFDPSKCRAENLIEATELYLESQRVALGRKYIPSVKETFPDAVAISKWADEEAELRDANLPNVIVDSACGIAVLRGADVYAPGVMGLPTNIPLDSKVNIFADVSGRCKRGLKIEFLDKDKHFVGIGILKQSRNSLFAGNLKSSGVAVKTVMPASKVPVLRMELFPTDRCLLQNAPSIICSRVLNPQRGDIVLDMCAAPGNKTTHLAEIIQNDGIIIALDKSANKIKNINLQCSQRSIACVHPFAYDSTRAVREKNHVKKSISDGPPFDAESFDRILLDAPCSALGQRPMFKFTIDEKTLKSYIPLQRKLFHSAVALLKRKGRLVYSTCTLMIEECENMVYWALKTFPDLELISAEPLLGGHGYRDSQLTELQRSMVQRFGPNIEIRNKDPVYNDSIGFFIAAFTKK